MASCSLLGHSRASDATNSASGEAFVIGSPVFVWTPSLLGRFHDALMRDWKHYSKTTDWRERRFSGLIRVQMIDDSGKILTQEVLRSRAFKEVSRLLFKDQVRKSV